MGSTTGIATDKKVAVIQSRWHALKGKHENAGLCNVERMAGTWDVPCLALLKQVEITAHGRHAQSSLDHMSMLTCAS